MYAQAVRGQRANIRQLWAPRKASRPSRVSQNRDEEQYPRGNRCEDRGANAAAEDDRDADERKRRGRLGQRNAVENP